MDIEFIEEEHRDNIFKLMEVCGVDMAQAYALYTNSGNNFEAAVQRKFNEGSNAHEYHQSPLQTVPTNDKFGDLYGASYEDEYDAEYEEYKKFVMSGKHFDSKYEIRQSEGFLGKIIPKFFKGSNENSFKKSLEEFVGKKLVINFLDGNLTQALHQVWKSKFPLFIQILSFTNDTKATLKTLYSDDYFVQNLNTQFRCYGINSKSYELEPQLKPFFNLSQNVNTLIVCRISVVDEIQILTKIKLQGSADQIKKKLKFAKSQCIQKEMDDMHIQKQFNEERKGNYDYVRPKSIRQHRKINEDRKIRKKQEEEFFAAMQPKAKVEEKQPQSQNIQTSSNSKPQVQPPKQIPKKVQESPEQIQKRRHNLRSKLTPYTSGVNIKLRYPSGQSIIFFVSGKESVQYLFDYVNSDEGTQLGFEHDNERRFDIVRPYDRLSLKDRCKESISSVFEDSDAENLVVNQIIE